MIGIIKSDLATGKRKYVSWRQLEVADHDRLWIIVIDGKADTDHGDVQTYTDHGDR